MNGDHSDDAFDALRYFVESGTATVNGESYNITDANITIDTSGVETLNAPDDIRETLETGEYEGSFTIELDEDDCETVVCPGCNSTNVLPPPMFLKMLSRDPAPCWECGYPLM